MNLTDLYERLAYGELSNLSLVEDGSIREEEQGKIVMHTNAALTALHTRFPLKDNTLILDQKGYLTTYSLTSKYALSNYVDNAPHSFYINDLGRPFEDDVLRITEVWDAYGEKLPLNDPHMWRSVFTPNVNVLQIPHPVEGQVISVQYQANHPKVSAATPEQVIDIPPFLERAVTLFVAGSVLSHMNTVENTAKGAEHLRAYELICVEVVALELVATGGTTSGFRFEKNGWV